MIIERLSIELSQRCSKACWFCYSGSHTGGGTRWTADALRELVLDCATFGVRAVSFGGGEPLESPLLWPTLAATRGRLFRSLTTHGLGLRDPVALTRLVAAAPDKVHVSIHFPGNTAEVERVIEQVHALASRGIRSGVNLLVRRSRARAAARAAARLRAAGIDNRRVVFLPMRGQDTPTPQQLAAIAGGPFQSMSCLTACARSPRFCAISWDKTVAWCSYTSSRAPLRALTYAGLQTALRGLGLSYCGDGLVRVRARAGDPRVSRNTDDAGISP
ncbi:MAG: radical SAM protein [Myxococcales bacterium]|nr:radical SAM protein [Myxococcales bacterium]